MANSPTTPMGGVSVARAARPRRRSAEVPSRSRFHRRAERVGAATPSTSSAPTPRREVVPVDAPARFTRDDQPGARWLIVSGEIDLGVADAFVDAMTDLVRDADGHAVVDLRRVTFLDSTGVNVLNAASTDAAARGVRLL